MLMVLNSAMALQFDEKNPVHPPATSMRCLWALVVALAGQIQGVRPAERSTHGFFAMADQPLATTPCPKCSAASEALQPFSDNHHFGAWPCLWCLEMSHNVLSCPLIRSILPLPCNPASGM